MELNKKLENKRKHKVVLPSGFVFYVRPVNYYDFIDEENFNLFGYKTSEEVQSEERKEKYLTEEKKLKESVQSIKLMNGIIRKFIIAGCVSPRVVIEVEDSKKEISIEAIMQDPVDYNYLFQEIKKISDGVKKKFSLRIIYYYYMLWQKNMGFALAILLSAISMILYSIWQFS